MNNTSTKKFSDLKLGQTAQFEISLTEDMIKKFSELSGDTNPLHVDEEYAKKTLFGGRIAHGLLGASFFSRLIGMHLPGKNALYLSQNLHFRLPIRIGMKLIVSGTVKQLVESIKTVTILTEITNRETGECLIGGLAVVKLLK